MRLLIVDGRGYLEAWCRRAEARAAVPAGPGRGRHGARRARRAAAGRRADRPVGGPVPARARAPPAPCSCWRPTRTGWPSTTRWTRSSRPSGRRRDPGRHALRRPGVAGAAGAGAGRRGAGGRAARAGRRRCASGRGRRWPCPRPCTTDEGERDGRRDGGVGVAGAGCGGDGRARRAAAAGTCGGWAGCGPGCTADIAPRVARLRLLAAGRARKGGPRPAVRVSWLATTTKGATMGSLGGWEILIILVVLVAALRREAAAGHGALDRPVRPRVQGRDEGPARGREDARSSRPRRRLRRRRPVEERPPRAAGPRPPGSDRAVAPQRLWSGSRLRLRGRQARATPTAR